MNKITKSYNSISNRIEIINNDNIKLVPCYILDFTEWISKNKEEITEYIAEYPEEFINMSREECEKQLFIQGPGPTGIYRDGIIYIDELI